MTNEEVDLIKKAILDSTEAYVDARFENLPFVKTEVGVIEGKGTTKGNKVRVRKVVSSSGTVIKEGALYDNIMSVGNIDYPNGSVVYLFVPNAQYNNMFIMGQLDDTPCNIVGGTINIGNGKFKVDSNGNAIVQGDIKADGKLELYWKGTDEGDPAGYYGALFLDEPIMSGNPMVRFDYPLYCDSGTCYISDINVEEYAYFGNEAYFYGNVYNRSGGVVFVSDRNAKEEIESLDVEKSAEFIYSQNPVSYKFKDGTSNRKHHGFIAQEVKETMEEDWGLYIDQSVNDKEKKDKVGSIGLRYDEYIADIIATCQYQKQQMDEMKKEIEELKNKLEVKNNGNDETDS